jgi:hypothetical protein
MFIAAYSITVKKWLIGEWMNKILYSHTMEYVLTTKKNEVLDTCYMMAKAWKYYFLYFFLNYNFY